MGALLVLGDSSAFSLSALLLWSVSVQQAGWGRELELCVTVTGGAEGISPSPSLSSDAPATSRTLSVEQQPVWFIYIPTTNPNTVPGSNILDRASHPLALSLSADGEQRSVNRLRQASRAPLPLSPSTSFLSPPFYTPQLMD